MTEKATESHQPSPPVGVSSSEALGPMLRQSLMRRIERAETRGEAAEVLEYIFRHVSARYDIHLDEATRERNRLRTALSVAHCALLACSSRAATDCQAVQREWIDDARIGIERALGHNVAIKPRR